MKTIHPLLTLGLAASVALGLSSCDKDKDKDKAEPQLTYQLNEAQSVANWQGHLRTGYFNEGSIAVQSEELTVKGGRVTGGTFVLPLASLKNFNLADEQKPLLIHHLQSADFFNMVLHPNLRFVITQVTPYQGGDASAVAGANYLVRGNLTLLDKTQPIAFPAKIDLTAEAIAVEADLKVDRTRWGITYAADPALPAADHILPDITLHLAVHGNPE